MWSWALYRGRIPAVPETAQAFGFRISRRQYVSGSCFASGFPSRSGSTEKADMRREHPFSPSSLFSAYIGIPPEGLSQTVFSISQSPGSEPKIRWTPNPGWL